MVKEVVLDIEVPSCSAQVRADPVLTPVAPVACACCSPPAAFQAECARPQIARRARGCWPGPRACPNATTHTTSVHSIAAPQTYYDAIYKEPQVFKQYHKDINKCESAEVTGWEDGQRTVTFGLALTIPAVVKKVVGALPARPWLWL